MAYIIIILIMMPHDADAEGGGERKEKERDKGIAEGTYNVKQCEIAASAARAPPTEQCVA